MIALHVADGQEYPFLPDIVHRLQNALRTEVRPVRSFLNLSFAYDSSRNQYNSSAILRRLLDVLPPGSSKIICLTDVDLFIPILTFVFGEAQLGGRAAVVSTARLVPSNVLPGDHRLFTTRLLKEAAHELGHTFGLVHCSVRECVMSRSASLLEVDAKSARFCSDCWTRYLDQRDHPGGTDE